MLEKIKDKFIDTTDLDLAHQEIGNLRDLCDAKDMVIGYQKQLLDIQAESLKQYRRLAEEFDKLKEEMKNEKPKDTKRKSTRLSKTIQDNN